MGIIDSIGLASAAAISLSNAVSESANKDKTNEPTTEYEDKYIEPNWFSYKEIICIDLNTVYSVRACGERVRFSLRKDGNIETSMLDAFDRADLIRKVSKQLIGG